MNRMKLERNIPVIYLSKVTMNLIFFGPVIVLFLLAQGLSLTRIMVLQTAFSIALVIFEVPSGFFADRIGRKHSIIIGVFALSIGCLVYSLGYTFRVFLVAEIIWALGLAFISGCDEALLYDTLAAMKREGEFQKIQGRAHLVMLSTFAVCALLGGYLGSIHLRWALYATFIGITIGIPVLFFLVEPPRIKGGHKRGELYYLYKIGRFALYKNREVRWLIWFGALAFGTSLLGFWLYQPYLKEAGVPVIWFGVIFACFNVFAAMSSAVAHRVTRRFGKALSLSSIPLSIGLSNLLMAWVIRPIGVIFVLGQQFGRGFSNPVISDYLNRQVWADKRATVNSLRSLFGRVIFIATAPMIGLLVDRTSVFWGLQAVGLFTLVAGAFLLMMMRKDHVI